MKRRTKIIFIVILVFVILYKSIFNTFTANFLLPIILPTFVEGEVKAKFTRFSLFFGFILEDVSISAPEEPEDRPLFQADRIAVTYNIPAFFIGRFILSEVSLLSPRINLRQMNGVWNYEKLKKPGIDIKDPAKEDVEIQEDYESLDAISTFIPISVYLHSRIVDMNLRWEKIEEGKITSASIEGFHYNLLLDTNRFRNLPLNTGALGILEEFYIHLNPDNPLRIHYSDTSSELVTDLDLKLSLLKEQGKNILVQHIDIGTDSIDLIKNNRSLPKLGMRLLLDSRFGEEMNEFILERFILSFKERYWIHLIGNYLQDSITSSQTYTISSIPTQIHFAELNPLLPLFPDLKNSSLSGILRLEEISLDGNKESTKTRWNIQGDNLDIRIKGTKHTIPKLSLIGGGEIFSQPDNSTGDPLAFLKSFQLEDLSLIYNGIRLKLTATVLPDSLVDLKFQLNNLYIQDFTNEARGVVSLSLKAEGKEIESIQSSLDARIRGLRYKLDNNQSGYQDLSLEILKIINLREDLKLERLSIPNILLKLTNERAQEFLNFRMGIDLTMNTGIQARLKEIRLKQNNTFIIPALPLSLRQTFIGLRSSLGNDLQLLGDIVYNKSRQGSQEIRFGLRAILPELGIGDLNLGGDILVDADHKNTIRIRSLTIDAFKKQLLGRYSGEFYKAIGERPAFGDKTGALSGKLSLESDKSRHLLNGLKFQGKLSMDINLKKNLIEGRLFLEDGKIRIESDGCKRKSVDAGISIPDCKYYDIQGVYLDIPIRHDLFLANTLTLTSGRKDNLIQNYAQGRVSNFRVEEISGSHPTIPNRTMKYVYPVGNIPGISCNIEYKENVFHLDDFNMYLLDGNISGKDVLFNMGSGNPKEMEATAYFRIRDIDLKKILPENSQNKIDDGKIKADLNLKIRDLTDPVGNINLLFSIHQIGKDFGTSAVNIVSPTNIITDAIIRSYSVRRVEVELNKGLVYAEILFNRSLLTRTIFSIEGDKLQEERIPLAKFLDRAQDEFQSYR